MTVTPQGRWERANPEKKAAHAAAFHAIRRGILIRPAVCSRCPNPNPHAHHEDYSKPLEVVWLCVTCHAQRHADLRGQRERRERIVALWADGLSIKGIAEVLDSTPGATGVEIVRMRAAGWDLPYRYNCQKAAA